MRTNLEIAELGKRAEELGYSLKHTQLKTVPVITLIKGKKEQVFKSWTDAEKFLNKLTKSTPKAETLVVEDVSTNVETTVEVEIPESKDKEEKL